MKVLISILLIAAFVVQCTSQVLIAAAFKINQEYIASNLCVNRFEAKSSCKGSCFLKKQLLKDKEQQEKLPDLKTKEVNLYCLDNMSEPAGQTAYVRNGTSYPIFNTSFYTSSFLLSIFHPPDQAV